MIRRGTSCAAIAAAVLLHWRLAACACDLPGAPSQTPQRQKDADAVVKACREIAGGFCKGFSGTFVVQERGRTVCSGAIGGGITLRSHFLIGSVTKQFTAAAIMKLAEQGVLSITDPLSKYVDLPGAESISIRNLMMQTSGMPEFSTLERFRNDLRMKPFTGFEPLIALLRKQIEQRTPPVLTGAQPFQYCNSNYMLLSAIIQKASGMPWQDYLEQNILLPAGMTHSSVFSPDQAGSLVPGALSDGERASVYEPQWASGAGGLQSTAEDLAKWDDAFYDGKVVSCDSVAEIVQPQGPPPDGSDLDSGYGYGIGSALLKGHRIYAHGGGIPGYTSQTLYLPEKGLSFSALQNSGDGALFQCVVPHLVDAALADGHGRLPLSPGPGSTILQP